MSIRSALASFRKELQAERDNPTAGYGIPTGIPGLDKRLRGLHRGTVVTVGGRTSMGKSVVAQTIVGNVCDYLLTTGDARMVGLISAEMSQGQVVQRFVSQQLAISRDDLLFNRLTDVQEERYEQFQDRVSTWPLEIYDEPRPELGTVKKVLDKWAGGWRKQSNTESPYAMIVIDHIGKIQVPDAKGSEYREVSEVAESVFDMARYYDCPVVAIAQINRGVEGRIDKGIEFTRPLPSDLRGSGRLEDDADVVLLLWRRERYEAMLEGREERVGTLEINVAKNRLGPSGAVYTTFDPEHARIVTAAEREVERILEGVEL